MYLFYSNYCKHCSMLLETLKTIDKNKKIKLISVDYLKSNNIVIDPRITHIPAMLLYDIDKIIFGKDVFDYLLLPGKGILLQQTNQNNESNQNNAENNLDEPQSIDSYMSQSYENLNENDNYLTGPVTIWEKLDLNETPKNISTKSQNQTENKFINNNDTSKTHKELPSLAEIQKMRENALS